jgi:hypothetical protein
MIERGGSQEFMAGDLGEGVWGKMRMSSAK